MSTLTRSTSRPESAIWSSPQFVVKPLVLLLARYGGLFALARALTSRRTRILAYHGIWLGEGHYGNHLFMSPAKFAARMALLERWRYPVVSLQGKSPSPRCATVITIDDGWYGTWSVMLPVLERHGYPATVYLSTYYCLNQVPVLDVALAYCFAMCDAKGVKAVHLPVYGYGPLATETRAGRKQALTVALALVESLAGDAQRQHFLEALCESIGLSYAALKSSRCFNLMQPAEVGDAARRGLCFEAHTHRHRTARSGTDCLAAELADNCAHIRALTGRTPEHFCYPSGRYSSAMWPVLERHGMASATTTEAGLAGAGTLRFALPRILDGQGVSELEFEAEMSGFMELWRGLRGMSAGIWKGLQRSLPSGLRSGDS